MRCQPHLMAECIVARMLHFHIKASKVLPWLHFPHQFLLSTQGTSCVMTYVLTVHRSSRHSLAFNCQVLLHDDVFHLQCFATWQQTVAHCWFPLWCSMFLTVLSFFFTLTCKYFKLGTLLIMVRFRKIWMTVYTFKISASVIVMCHKIISIQNKLSSEQMYLLHF